MQSYRIEGGKLADLLVLPEDILTCDAKHLERMAVDITMVGGRIVHQRPGS
jgi:predicted amidohydrolase YtcJ